ncbi:MAG: hypothetical protein V3S98_07515 [Dehalococcoidia bacterium]
MASNTSTKHERYGDFNVEVSTRNLGLNLPQRMGKALWLPMLLMAIMAFPIAFVLGAVGASELDGGDAATAAVYKHAGTGVMFIGFTAVFSAIVFAIARILGAFREGGGGIQETSGRRVLTLVMPATAKAMLLLMMMGMMMLIFGIVAEFVLASELNDRISSGTAASVQTAQSWATWIEGLRRFGVATYLLSISFGLYTIVNVIRLQSRRIRELGDEAAI